MSDEDYQILQVTSTAPVTIVARRIIGVINDSTSTQPGTLFGYDSTGSTAGTPLFEIAANMGSEQVLTFPNEGLQCKTLSFTCVASVTPTGAGFQVLYD